MVKRTIPLSLVPDFAPPQHKRDVRALNRLLFDAGYKWCPGCRRAVPLADFPVRSHSPLGVGSRCVGCRIEPRPEQAARRRVLRRIKVYGLAPADYDALLAAQGGGCALCGSPPSVLPHARKSPVPVLMVDHDHETGKVRGLLCSPCNAGLGNFKDDPALLRRAIAYLARSS